MSNSTPPSETAPVRIGVVGLGAIGGGIAASAQRAGMRLSVFDVVEPATAPFAGTATVAPDVASLRPCDVVVVAVVNDAQVREVLTGPGGLASGAAEGPTTAVVVSTVSLETVRELAGPCAAAGIRLLDCGVSGGPSAASAGELIAMVGGDAEDVERVRPALEQVTSLLVHTGPLGSGLACKLARNVIQYGSWLAAFEGQRIAQAAGVRLADLAKVVRASDAKIGGPSTLMFRETTSPFGPGDDAGLVGAMEQGASLAVKDVAAARELAAELALEVPLAVMLAERVRAVFGVGDDVVAPPGGPGGSEATR